MASVDLYGFGHVESEDVSTTKTLDATDVGIVQNTTATMTYTLPATSAKFDFIIRVAKAGLTVTISPNASDKISGYTAANTGVGADNKDLIFTTQPAGSYVHLHGDGTDGYQIVTVRGVPTFES